MRVPLVSIISWLACVLIFHTKLLPRGGMSRTKLIFVCFRIHRETQVDTLNSVRCCLSLPPHASSKSRQPKLKSCKLGMTDDANAKHKRENAESQNTKETHRREDGNRKYSAKDLEKGPRMAAVFWGSKQQVHYIGFEPNRTVCISRCTALCPIDARRRPTTAQCSRCCCPHGPHRPWSASSQKSQLLSAKGKGVEGTRTNKREVDRARIPFHFWLFLR